MDQQSGMTLDQVLAQTHPEIKAFVFDLVFIQRMQAREIEELRKRLADNEKAVYTKD